MNKGVVTVISSESPAHLGKVYSIDADGQIVKATAGQMALGRFDLKEFADAAEFAELLATISTAQALCATTPTNGQSSGDIASKALQASRPGSITRTKADFAFSAGQRGCFILDFDPTPEGAMTREELWQVLRDVVPGVDSAGVVWWCSGSSHIWQGEREVQGLRGQRFYVLVEDLADTVRAMGVLTDRLWLQGHGRVEVSASGALLERSTFDTAMAQPARLDFCGGAVVGEGISQWRPPPLVLAHGGWLDTSKALPNLTVGEAGRVEALKQEAKAARRGAAEAARGAWRAKRVAEGLPALMSAGASAADAEDRIGRAVDAAFAGTLLGDFVLTVVHSDGSCEAVSVERVLQHRDVYHEADCLDPLNPGHRDGAADCRLFLHSSSPVAFSLDDGGVVYRLRRQSARIEYSKGNRNELVSAVADELAKQDDVFMGPAGPVLVVNGATHQLTALSVQNLAGHRIALFCRGKGGVVPADLTREQADLVLAELRVREAGLSRLVGTVTMPYPTPSGRIVTKPGFDAETGLLLHLEPGHTVNVPSNPSEAQICEALRTMAAPWSAYRFASADDAAALLSAIITAVCRPVLPLAPGFLLEACQQSSGKTLAARALGNLALGVRCGVTPYAKGDGDDEVRKRLFSIAIGGLPFTCIDNVVGTFKSAALAAMLTTGVISDRVLGRSEELSVDARILVTASGNNCVTDADLGRRLAVIRLDAGNDPKLRKFSFDPPECALGQRQRIAAAVCTLIAGWVAAGRPVPSDDAGGFVDWTAVCRAPVLWAAAQGFADVLGWGAVGDSAASLLRDAAEFDPEVESLGELLRGLYAATGGAVFKSSDVLTLYTSGADARDDAEPDGMVHRAARDILGLRAQDTPSAKSLGRALQFRRERVVGSLKLLARGSPQAATKSWQVVRV